MVRTKRTVSPESRRVRRISWWRWPRISLRTAYLPPRFLRKRQADGCFVVWDGNRRVTALKLLDDPTLAPDPALRKRFENIKARHPSVSVAVDILVSSDDEAFSRK